MNRRIYFEWSVCVVCDNTRVLYFVVLVHAWCVNSLRESICFVYVQVVPFQVRRMSTLGSGTLDSLCLVLLMIPFCGFDDAGSQARVSQFEASLNATAGANGSTAGASTGGVERDASRRPRRDLPELRDDGVLEHAGGAGEDNLEAR